MSNAKNNMTNKQVDIDDKPWHSFCADAKQKLKDFPDNYFDSCVMDPPYFLIPSNGNKAGGFMGKEWDGLHNFENKILCRSKEFVQFVVKNLLSLRVELNTGEDVPVQENVNTKASLKIERENLSNVQSVKKKSIEQNLKSDQTINSVQGIVLTKEEVLGSLRELSLSDIIAIESLSENVAFVIPTLFIQVKNKNSAQENVLKLLIKKICSAVTIQPTLMEEVRIQSVIEEMTGMLSENQFTNVTNTNVGFVENTVSQKRYSVITLNHTEIQKIIQQTISLLSVMFVTQRSRGNPNHFLIELWFHNLSEELYRVLKPGGYVLSFGGTRTYHRMVCGLEDAGFEIRDCLSWLYAQGFCKSHNLREHGVGTALKPAYEPIAMARKPLDGTVEETFKKWGTGVLHIERSRVSGDPWKFGTQTDIKGGKYGDSRPSDGDVFRKNVTGGELGRWPANLMHDGSPEVVALFPESKGQLADVKGTEKSYTGQNGIYSKFNRTTANPKRNDSGSAARFFHEFKHDEEDLDFIRFIFNPKTSRSDRNEGVQGLKKPMNWSSGTKNPGSFQSKNTDRSSVNNHPTVKPTALMQYLVKLVTPVGGKCVDPCCGSGSTGKACVLEDIEFYGIDLEQQWIDISEQRMIWAWNKKVKIK